MKHLVAVLFAFSVGSAFANGCPGEMKAIDAKMTTAQLSAPVMTQVKELRAKGEQMHKDGKHADSMAALGQAKKLLGL